MEKLIKILRDIRPDIDFTVQTHLVEDCILDSLDIVTLVTEINDAFSISVPVEEITPENFNSAACIMSMIERIK